MQGHGAYMAGAGLTSDDSYGKGCRCLRYDRVKLCGGNNYCRVARKDAGLSFNAIEVFPLSIRVYSCSMLWTISAACVLMCLCFST